MITGTSPNIGSVERQVERFLQYSIVYLIIISSLLNPDSYMIEREIYQLHDAMIGLILENITF